VLKRWEQQVNSDDPTDRPAHSLDDALNYFVDHATSDLSPETVRMYVEKGGQLVRLLGTRGVNELSLDDVHAYIKHRLDEGAARSTVAKELCTLRRALGVAQRRGIFVGNARALMPEFRARYVPRNRYLTLDEFRALIGVLPPHRQLWMLVAVFTGGRDSEVDGLEWRHIDWNERMIWLAGTKTQKSARWVPLHPVLKEVLSRHSNQTGHIVGEWSNARRDLAAACKRIGIPRVSPNDLRRTYASWMKQQGVDSKAVAELLGHSSTRMVDLVYGHLNRDTLKRAVAALPGGWDNSGTDKSAFWVFCVRCVPGAEE
jgi:integrase